MVKVSTRMAAIGTIASMVFAVACGTSDHDSDAGGTAGGGGSGAGGTIQATVKDFAIAVGPSSVGQGDVTFDITNDGPSTHEFVVIATDAAADQLPVSDNEVDESSVDVAGEQEDIAPGTSASLDLSLPPGAYVVICNIPGHYGQGMHAAFTVN